ncbi:type IV conjugative transfer system lipoprotein TraV [Testudinibacter sp. TR-2022]|uniref:type IV conjugative transfer system lipoprotein TraV n=1 Tax=Testudinibacter sp. TR-2022 TaxID=2585029 RepID=UPI001117F998|nr:type IV conjugative transfer system lipoprotein TraV [Testudinibacter sp. TR-2022]TNH04042.1 type IV conjugative transfer system lipoprotein TraV [Pasteurellaceae bacterium Phil31]TNH10173.1 type IV conjugative transfer system lipoprotein TraV [Testudinibacter sp. TR-2022]TNH13033.1 type IV conjugative transfer system lipoprotein TraV [Testudinibacter sp. TR-2022]
MKLTALWLCAPILLTGCAGMNSEFEFSTPAKDSGYWMQQADEMTGDESGVGKKQSPFAGLSQPVNLNSYKLLNLNNIRLSVKSLNDKETAALHKYYNITMIEEKPFDPYCDTDMCYPEPQPPFRMSDTVLRTWIAPYVSPDNNAHLGEVVYFVTKQSRWQGIEE